MNIGFFIDNSGIKTVRCNNLSKGNPGIGGTEYCILLLAESYKNHFPNDKVFLFCTAASELPQVDDIVIVDTLLSLPEAVKKRRCDLTVLAYSSTEGKDQKKLFQNFSKLKQKVVIWGHNYYFENDCNLIADTDCIVANVFVGKQQYDRYIDHRIIKKSIFIYNMYPENKSNFSYARSENLVTFIGSLIPAKGFHILAKQWGKILQEVPDAELYIIGSGKLYNRDEKLGKFMLAEESYENQFMSYLTDSNGEILDSVHFMGVLGPEKEEIVKKTKVGIVNPSGRTETFGISALDFESFGIPVVTIAKGGFLDTIQNKKTGLLFCREKSLSKYVNYLLKNDLMNKELGLNAFNFTKSFSVDKIICEWNRLFTAIDKGERIEYIPVYNFYFKELKLLRLINRKIKELLGVEKGISIIGIETIGWKVLRKMRSFK